MGKLHNKKTGEIELANIIMDDDKIAVIAADMPLCGNSVLGKYDSLAELNEEWEDYKPKTNSRFRLVKDLPTFKAGEIFEIFDGNLYKINESDGDDTEYEVMAYHASTLKRFPNILEEWFEPIEAAEAEPLIKDEKVRKAVRAWAEAQGLTEVYLASNGYEIYGGVDDWVMQFKGEPFPFADKNKIYTIAELCGEEEE